MEKFQTCLNSKIFQKLLSAKIQKNVYVLCFALKHYFYLEIISEFIENSKQITLRETEIAFSCITYHITMTT